jgi:hypothetical protein
MSEIALNIYLTRVLLNLLGVLETKILGANFFQISIKL